MSDAAYTLTGKQIPHDEQKKAGAMVSGPVGDEHRKMLEVIFRLLDGGEIDPFVPSTLLNEEVYEALDEQWQDKIDLCLNNIANEIRLIDNYRKNGGDINSIHFHTMVEHIWDMKQRIEEYHDAFKF